MKTALLIAFTFQSLLFSSNLWAQDQTSSRQAVIAVKQLGEITNRKDEVAPMWVVPSLNYLAIDGQDPQCSSESNKVFRTYGQQTALTPEFQMVNIPIVERIVQGRGEGSKKINCTYQFAKIYLYYGIGRFDSNWSSHIRVDLAGESISSVGKNEIQMDFGLETVGWHGTFPRCKANCNVSLDTNLNAAITFHYQKPPAPPKLYNGVSTEQLRKRQAAIQDESPSLPIPSVGEAPPPPLN